MRFVAGLALLAGAALAQGKAFSFDDVLVKPAELPKKVHVADGIHSVSPQAKTYFETPAMKDIMKTLAPEAAARVSDATFEKFPVPKRKECQSFKADGRTAGSVFLFECEEGDADDVVSFLKPYLLGEGRSEQHPEEIIVAGRFIWVLSFPFPPGDPAAEWYKERLRKKFKVPALRERPELAQLGKKIAEAFDAKDGPGGIKLLQSNAKAVADWSFGQCMLGQFAEMKEDNALAEKAFRKALQLNDSVADPLEPGLVWVTLDGLALALHAQGKRPEALKLLERAITAAAECDDNGKHAQAQSRYNIACVYAMMKKYPEALDNLQDAVDLDPSYLETARTDEDFAEARKLPPFQEFLSKERSAPSPSFDAVLVKADELPGTIRSIEGMHTNEPHPQAFYETPSAEGFAKILPPELRTMLPKEYMESFPVPKRKQYQSFVAEGGEEGTVFVYEYETDDLGLVTSFLEPILWGEGGPSEDHPEEIIVQGKMLWIISFPRGDPAAEWYKDRLRKKFKVPAQRSHDDLGPIGAKLADCFGKRDAAGGLKVLADNAAAVERWAFAQCMLGQFAELKGDHALAEKGFRKALQLHESCEDPLDANFVWACLDGLGEALAGQGKAQEAARMFEKAIAAGNKLDGPWAATRSCYHIACVLALMQEWDQAYQALKQVLSVDEQYKDLARRDPSLAEARKRKEFQELLR